MYNDKKWAAASHAKDSKALNKNFGAVNMAETTELHCMVNALIQSVSRRDKSKDSCNNCGELEYWVSTCPKKKQGKGKFFNSKDKSSQNNPGRRGQHGGWSPRTPPPKDGESEIKFINDKKHYWCAKCNCWTPSLGTDTHKSKEELKGQPKVNAGMACVNFSLHPMVFKLCCILLNPAKEKPPNLTKFLFFGIRGAIASMSTLWWMAGVHPELASNVLLSIKTMWHRMPEIIQLMKDMLGSSVIYLKEQVPLVAKTVSANWLGIAMAGISGAIGFGTASRVYHQSEGSVTCFRMGENHLKKVWRLNKPRKLSRRSRSVKSQPIWFPPDDCRENRCQNL